MKKILASLLTLSVLLTVTILFAGCGSEDAKTEENIFYCYSDGDEFQMTLPAEFHEMDTGSYYELYFSGGHVMVDPMAASSFTPKEGYPPLDLKGFSEFIVDYSIRDVELLQEDSYDYFDESDETHTIYSFCLASENSFWWVQCSMSLEKATAEQALDSFKQWVGTIVITPAEE